MRLIGHGMQLMHDTRLYYPLCSTQRLPNAPGSADATNPAGYSWLVQLTPFMDEAIYFDQVQLSSQQLRLPLFDPSRQVRIGDWEGHASSYPVAAFRCPSVSHEQLSDDGAGDSAPSPAIGSYLAMAGTHFRNQAGVGRFHDEARLTRGFAYEGDGVMPFPGKVGVKTTRKGLSRRSLVDGISKTIAFAESRETATSAWADGQTMWLVAAWPGSSNPPRPIPYPKDERRASAGWAGAEVSARDLSLRFFQTEDASESMPYLRADRWSGSLDRRWGPSSLHPGVIGHAFADGGVAMLSEGIDPEVYLHLVTRIGMETVEPEAIEQFGRSTRPASYRPNDKEAGLGPIRLGDVTARWTRLQSGSAWVSWREDGRLLLAYAHNSKHFSRIDYDVEAGVIQFTMNERLGATTTYLIAEQLKRRFGPGSTRAREGAATQQVWVVDERGSEGGRPCRFVLTHPTKTSLPNLEIRISPVNATKEAD